MTQDLAAIADRIGLDDPAHQPEKRGILRLLGDMETSIMGMGSRRHVLFVLRKDDLEAVLGAIKIAEWAQSQMKGRAKP